jgi:hypothetical protein
MNKKGWMEKTEKFEISYFFIPGRDLHFSGTVKNLSELKSALRLLEFRIEQELMKRQRSGHRCGYSPSPEEMLFPAEIQNLADLPIIRSRHDTIRKKRGSGGVKRKTA